MVVGVVMTMVVTVIKVVKLLVVIVEVVTVMMVVVVVIVTTMLMVVAIAMAEGGWGSSPYTWPHACSDIFFFFHAFHL